MSKVLDKLSSSLDPVDRELARTLMAWQDAKELAGRPRHLGREPGQIEKRGSVYVIESRIRSGAVGFGEVGAENSYESIVVKHPRPFHPDVRKLALDKLQGNLAAFEPTSDDAKLERRVQTLLVLRNLPAPIGVLRPARRETASTKFDRDPKVKAYVLRQAKGHCEACDAAAPFTDKFDAHYLEVHHVRMLAEGGSDRLSNAVALCPNCHRATHYAADSASRVSKLYKKIGRLVRE